MSHSVSEENLARLSAFVAARMGLHFPRDRWRDLERGLSSAARESNFEDCGAYIEWLMSSASTRSQIESLASNLTVGETYFFRDRKVFETLEDLILPELIQSHRREGRKQLRIWSAACASGEEPYSIAILLSRMLPDLHDWHITILATDINPRFLQKAADGVYGNWSFRDVPSGIKERFFKPCEKGRLEVIPQIKKMVQYSYLNLAEDCYPSLFNKSNAMDMIFCRNVLMYFTPERAKQVVHNLHHALLDGGLLVVSPGEASHILFSEFATVISPGAILYRKQRQQCQLPPAFPGKSAERPGSRSTTVAEEISGRRVEATPASHKHAIPVEALTPLALETDGSGPETPIAQLEAPKERLEARISLRELYRQSLALYNGGCYAEAAERAQVLVGRDPTNTQAMTLLARAYANVGELAKALEWCERAVADDKLNAGIHYLLATILQELDRAEAATHSLKRALYLDPNLILAHVALGNINRQSGKPEESARHFENALALLSTKRPEDVLSESEGMTAQRLTEIIRSTISVT